VAGGKIAAAGLDGIPSGVVSSIGRWLYMQGISSQNSRAGCSMTESAIAVHATLRIWQFCRRWHEVASSFTGIAGDPCTPHEPASAA